MASMHKPSVMRADVAVVGAGAAGLYAALCAAREGASVLLVSATPLAQTASYWAQGGLAAALAADDSAELHLADTERAGRELVRRSAAEILVREAPNRVADLQALGVRFDADRFGRLALGLEGGHSIRRIVHAGGSATGRRLVRQLSALAAENRRITVLEGARARALWMQSGPGEPPAAPRADEAEQEPAEDPRAGDRGRCQGLVCEYVNGSAQQRETGVIGARAVVLATGGMAAMWSRTTNPPGSQGIGLMLAQAAGAKLADLELLQFHPTAVIGVPGREGFLVTEAIRGEGATLHDMRSGERFVDELAPRDEVARAIQARLRETGASAVGLDMRAIDAARFPNVVAALREAGLDPASELVPVAPAAHYSMGGIAVDLQARSSVPGLYAVGETSCTGLHGANRLASNSLSECFVFARRAVADALAEPAPTSPAASAGSSVASATAVGSAGSSAMSPMSPMGAMGAVGAAGRSPSASELEALASLPAPMRVTRETRMALWRDAGVERSEEGLRQLLSDRHPLARLIARCALARDESRGAHLRVDRPERDPALDYRHAVLDGEGEVSWEMWQ